MTRPSVPTQKPPGRWKTPRLRVGTQGDSVNHASWIELFFDLVFVIVIDQLSHFFSDHLSLVGFLQFAALFIPCWWAWVLFTFYVDRYDTDDVIHRVLVLTGMLTVLILANNIHDAFDKGTTAFILSYVGIRSLVLLLYVRASHYVQAAKANVRLYSMSYIPSLILWVVSLALPIELCYVMWGIAITIELAVPIVGSRILAGTPVHPSHLPERFGLFTLIVLGETIVSVASATQNITWNFLPTIAAVGGFVIAACLWWLYFSFLESAVIIRGIGSVHVYNYGHFPILLSLATIAVGVAHTIAEVGQSTLGAATRWALCGGVALYILSVIAIMMVACRRHVTVLSLIVIAIALGLAVFGAVLPSIAIEGVLIAVLLLKVIADITRPIEYVSDKPQE